MSKNQSPIVLAFSGGLDTSFCVPWLKETYGRDVVTATVHTGGIGAAAAKQLEERAYALGASEHVLIDAKQDFFDSVIRYLIAGNVLRGLRGSPTSAAPRPWHTVAQPPAMTKYASRSRCVH